MIESRYKIEYVLPDEKPKKASSFRVLWYLLLTSLILLAVTAITYDFSIQNIQKDSLVLIEKAKIHVFNLSNSQQFKRPEKTKEIAERKPIRSSIQKPTISTLPTVVENTENKIITKLTNQQELQLETIKEQIEKNSQLSKDLNKLSSQLVLEKTKNQSLYNKLSEQEKDSIKLTEQLNKMLSGSADNEVILEDFTPEVSNINSLTDITTKEVTPKKQPEADQIAVNKDTTIFNKEEKTQALEANKVIEAMKTVSPDTDTNTTSQTVYTKKEVKPVSLTNKINAPIENKLDKVINEYKEFVSISNEAAEELIISPDIMDTANNSEIEAQKNNQVEASGQSATDKIIAAMNSIKSDPNIKEITEKDVTAEADTPEKNNTSSQKIIEESIQASAAIPAKTKSEVQVEQTAVSLPTTATQIIIDTTEPVEKELLIANTEVKPVAQNKLANGIDVINPETTPETVKIEKTENTSAIDDIIAAMEQTQSNPASNTNIDPELEKDIKNQLVEQGDLSIDN